MIQLLVDEKKYSDSFKLSGLEITIEPSKITLLLGHNGSGKTTAIKSLFGLTDYKGRLLIDEQPIDYNDLQSIQLLKETIGYISDDSSLFYFLTANEYLSLQRSATRGGYDTPFIDQLIKLFQFEQYLNEPIEELSYGNKKKLQIISQLARKPKYIVIDEPTNGLDPDMIIVLKKLLIKLKNTGIGMLVCTHNLRFGEELMDSVVIMREGQVLLHSTKNEILSIYDTQNMESVYQQVNEHYYNVIEGMINAIHV